MKVSNEIILSGTFTTNQTSSPVNVDQLYGFCVQSNYSGTAPVGVLTIQATNDQADDPKVTPVWSDETTTVAIAGAGNTMLNLDHRYYKFFRVRLVVTSGTIIISVKFNAKGP